MGDRSGPGLILSKIAELTAAASYELKTMAA